MYIWEHSNWPYLAVHPARLTGKLAAVHLRLGQLAGRMASLGFGDQDETELSVLSQEVIKSSEIEGEFLDPAQVRSSLARRLGLDDGGVVPIDRHVEGIVEMMLDASRHYSLPLTQERLFAWHGALFPTGRSGLQQIRVAAWRDDATGPMQVISGVYGHERVHYQAPPAALLEQEMRSFFDWCNAEDPALDPVVKAALAHFRFVTLHPFDDGNGRIARAIGEMMLARSEGTFRRYYSFSAQILRNRREYYRVLEKCQKGSLDVTDWVEWVLDNLGAAMDMAEDMVRKVLDAARFWERHRVKSLNPRQVALINLLLKGFEGNLTTSKWAKIGKCSQDTALRDIVALINGGLLRKTAAGGRSTCYELVDV